MIKNMHQLDRIARLFLVLGIGSLLLTGGLSGWAAWAGAGLTLIFLFTGLTGFCPLYRAFNFSTKKG